MKWNNVKLIFLREARDQLRDRRTLFTIAGLPLLLYPLMGMVFVQISQFMREHPTRVRLIGVDDLPDVPALLSGGKFHAGICPERERHLLELIAERRSDTSDDTLRIEIERDINVGKYDAAVFFPPRFAARLAESRSEAEAPGRTERIGPETAETAADGIPRPAIYYNTASDKSRIAHDRVERVLGRWRDLIVLENLRSSRLPESAAQPFELRQTDVAEEVSRRAAMWSKIMPFIALIWALTGAFYPAIDLCAGEKERGTLETLLSSPAERGEIVWGKLLTVMSFSMATSTLNLASMGFTASVFVRQYAQATGTADLMRGPPPMASLVWLVAALVPASALFSALAIAIAAFARSTKEGQYYLMPLLFVTLPLMILPLLPTSELTLGTSLIPISGLMMLLRALIEGQYAAVLPYVVPVAGVTIGCCLLAIRWAVDQFSNESVLFRESERGGLGAWIRHLMRVRGETPSVAQGILCALLLLIIRFFASMFVRTPGDWSGFVRMILIVQLALIATPAIQMTLLLTRSPRATLLLRWPRAHVLALAALLAVALHPAALAVGDLIRQVYPINDDAMTQMAPLARMLTESPLLSVILVIGLVPAVCEEIAFRGFILSGLRHMGHKWAAIILTALFFGWTHSLLQQQIAATFTGIVIGYVAVQSGSILPPIAFHLVHNGLTAAASRLTPERLADSAWLSRLYGANDGSVSPTVFAIGLSIAAGAAVLWLFRRVPHPVYVEESLRATIDHRSARGLTLPTAELEQSAV
ncbi:MAG: CPBP family intramembrane metalloprotease [Planctomycetes bacterium]|nr:CPBP family intramembrane metalloprotease [Planctomycetota bacterium]